MKLLQKLLQSQNTNAGLRVRSHTQPPTRPHNTPAPRHPPSMAAPAPTTPTPLPQQAPVEEGAEARGVKRKAPDQGPGRGQAPPPGHGQAPPPGHVACSDGSLETPSEVEERLTRELTGFFAGIVKEQVRSALSLLQCNGLQATMVRKPVEADALFEYIDSHCVDMFADHLCYAKPESE